MQGGRDEIVGEVDVDGDPVDGPDGKEVPRDSTESMIKEMFRRLGKKLKCLSDLSSREGLLDC